LALAGSITATDGQAADHQEAPGIAGWRDATDIADFYAWHTEQETLVVVITYLGYASPITGPIYDEAVLYEIHVDRDGDRQPEVSMDIRFGANNHGEWGVRAVDLPGENEPLQGPIETALTGGGGARLWAGNRDDPFFFDLEGYTMTLGTGALSFDSTRDFASFRNANAIVVEVPLAAALDGAERISLWATTGRLP
jgi:hypothetical protein